MLRSFATASATVATLILAPLALADQPSDPGANGTSHVQACPGRAPAGFARCHAEVRTDPKAKPQPNGTPAGYLPADLQSAYALPSATAGSGRTIAIIDAFDDPRAETDLAIYRSKFGLPPCTTANGCFRKVDQNGGTSYPRSDAGWAQEISLDLDMASAVCPNCKLLLVETVNNAFTNLATGVDTAAALGAVAISNSYGGSEFSSETSATYESHYNHPGVTVSSGDSGFGVEFPAASRYVTAVGGTSLTRAGGSARGWSESAWSGAGSGCSAYVPKPAWQTDAGCTRRTVADVSAVANPSTGVAVYDSFRTGGWLVFGGTSASAPIVAGAIALAGGSGSPSTPYSHAGSLFDITTGSNGSCSVAYLCHAGAGFDGPTGLGTPNGVGAF